MPTCPPNQRLKAARDALQLRAVCALRYLALMSRFKRTCLRSRATLDTW